MQVAYAGWLKKGALLLLFVPGLAASAQFTSSVQGTVSDPSGAVVANAGVTLTNTDTGIAKSTRTDGSGVYHFVNLPPGPYQVRVAQPGFLDSETAVTVTADETAGASVKLRVGTSTSSVEVTDEATSLNPEETRFQYTLGEKEIRNLPNQNSATLGLVRLAPGTTGIVEGQNNLTENRSLPEANANGLDSAANLYTLDDVPITSSQNFASAYNGNVGGQVIFVPNLSSIGEVALQTTTFAVDYGSAASMVVAFGTKSGANAWHGIADESYGDKVLNAFGYNTYRGGAAHRHVYSFGVGGPIVKNRTFFWGSFERRDDLEPTSSGAAQFFTPQFAQSIQNPANDPNQVSVTAFIKNAPNTRALFVPSQSDKTAAQYFGGCANGAATTAYNTPCGMLVTQNAIEAASHVVNGKNYSVRVDQYFRDGKDRLFGYYFSMDQLSDSESIAPAFDGYTPTNGHHFATNYAHQFSPSLINQATFGYTDFTFNFTTTPHSVNMVTLPFLFLNLGVDNFTRFVPFSDQEKQYYGRDGVLWAHGNHNFDIGLEIANNVSNDDRTGIYTRPLFYLWFTPQDFFDDKLDLYNLSNYYSGSTGNHIGDISAAENLREGVYFQDTWKVRPNLTLTYGLRWDDLGNPSPYGKTIPFGNITNSVPDGVIASTDFAKALTIAATKHAYASRQNLNFDPRIGFAWAPVRSDASTVLRGGFGLYQDLANLQNIASQVTSNPPGILGYTACCSETLGYGTNTDASKGYGFTNIPVSIAPPMYRPDGSVIGSAANVSGVDPHLKPQRSMLWQLSFEHEFAGKLVGAVTYTGSHSYDLTYTADLARPNGSAVVTTKPDGSLTETTTLANPNFGAITPYLSGVLANYNGLTASMRQNYRGYVWQASYNWGHALADPNGLGSTNEGIVNSYDPKAQYGNAGYDVRNSFKVSGLAPIGARSRNGVVEAVFGNWNLNNVIIGQTGEPFTVYYGNQVPATDFARNNKTPQIPDYTGSRRSWSRSQWKTGIFTPTYSEFTAPIGPIGNQGTNSFRNANYITWDANLVKRIDLPWLGAERSHLSLRVDGFNLLNRFNPGPIQLNNLGNPGGQQIDGGTGPTTTSAFQARILQLGARFEF